MESGLAVLEPVPRALLGLVFRRPAIRLRHPGRNARQRCDEVFSEWCSWHRGSNHDRGRSMSRTGRSCFCACTQGGSSAHRTLDDYLSVHQREHMVDSSGRRNCHPLRCGMTHARACNSASQTLRTSNRGLPWLDTLRSRCCQDQACNIDMRQDADHGKPQSRLPPHRANRHPISAGSMSYRPR